jgi:N5-(cytidine 5'-diphosphoramidyl)-L-glutamine hydrolase
LGTKENTLRVALTMRVAKATEYTEFRDSISQDWLRRFADWNITPLLIPNILISVREYLSQLKPDLIILTGGDDLGIYPERDKTEFDVLKASTEMEIPLLGVCRGLQLCNVYFGGTLSPIEDHAGTNHVVNFQEPFHQIYGSEKKVNSYHNIGVIDSGLGRGLVPVARDSSGAIEGYIHEKFNLACVMWHPERNCAVEGDKLLIEKLVEHRIIKT